MKNSNYIFLLSLVFGTILSFKSDSEALNTIVQKGDFLSTQTESGDLMAVNSMAVTMPFIGWRYGWQYKIVDLVDHGDIVSKGDTVASIDNSSVIRVIQEEQNNLEVEEANYKKLKATHKSRISQLESELATEKANLSLILLQVEKFKFEPDKKQEIKSLEQDIAEIKLERVEREIALQKVIMKNEINIQITRIKQIIDKIKAAEEALSRLTLLSPIDGIAQLEINRRTDKMVSLGDETRQGWTLLKVPDMSAMKVSGVINESDIYKINSGQKVNVRLDAYPSKIFKGEISYIGKLSREKEEGSDLKVFDFEILMADSDPALKPGMTVSCQIILAELSNTLFISNKCLFTEGEQKFVFVKKAGNANKVEVEVLGRNSKHTAVSGKIKQGDKLLTQTEMISYLSGNP